MACLLIIEKMTYRKLDGLDPNFRIKTEKFLEEAKPLGVFITETFRSAERQNKLFNEGKSYIDGLTHLGQHQKGLAFDIAFMGPELYPEDHKIWEKVGKIANKHGIDWGYDLWAHTGFIDQPHFQDNGVAFVTPPAAPKWAEVYIKKMQDKKIDTSPMTKVGDMPLYQLVGVMDKYFS